MNHKLALEMPFPYWHGVYRTLRGPHGGIIPRRMSEAHEEWYRTLPPEKSHWLERAITATGCRIQVSGSIRHLSFAARHVASCRPFFGYDVRTPQGFQQAFTSLVPQEEFSFELDFPDDTMGMTLLFPYECDVEVLSCSIDADGELAPVDCQNDKILFFGDSITQGWEAVNPADSYACRLAEALHCDYCNVSVGGTILNRANVAYSDGYQWSRAILAFGVNDAAWNVPVAQFAEEAQNAITRLTSRVGSRVAVLSPIWWPGAEQAGKVEHVCANRQVLREVCSLFPLVKYIDGLQLVPADRKYFADDVHPNAEGMARMAGSLAALLGDWRSSVD